MKRTFVGMKGVRAKRALLDAAEALFAERGFAATSVRDISARAGVNLAAASYHFGGKRGLMEAVMERRITPLNQERLRRLDRILTSRGRGRRPALEPVLEAFVGPALTMAKQGSSGGRAFVRLMGRTFIEPDPGLHAFFLNLFQEVAARFIPAIQRAVPGLAGPDLFWRLHFMVGAMAQTLSDREPLRTLSGGEVDPDDAAGAIRQLVAFIAGGLRAPAVSGRGRRNA